MEDRIRLFVAAALPDLLKQQLQHWLQAFRLPGVREMPLQNLHLTLFFIGEAQATNLPAIHQAIKDIAATHPPFRLDFESLEPGPNPRHPRLVWARFSTHPTFTALSHHLTDALAITPPKHLKAIPHVTMARLRKDQPKPALPPAITAAQAGPLHLAVHEIGLWHSALASPHPRYTVLHTFPLGQNPPQPNAV